MLTTDQLARGGTLAEAQGMTQELGRAAAALAAEELARGRLDAAREILEGLAICNPHEPAAWTMLAVVERRRGKLLAARVCAETAFRLAAGDLQIRLVRAEVLLGTPAERPRALPELRELAASAGPVGDRARALLAAAGAPS